VAQGAATATASRARAKTRLFARLRAAGRAADACTVAFGRPVAAAGRLHPRRRRPASPGATCASSPARRTGAPRSATANAADHRRAAASRCGSSPAPRADLRRLPGERDLAPARRAASSCGSGPAFSSAPLRALRDRRGRCTSGARIRAARAPIPRRGKLVAIQYLEEATERWRPVLVTRSDHGGRFRARYRFRYVSGIASIRLRATALAEERWPYAPVSSRPVTVSVRGR
jgi:hypothetical protein